MRAGNRRLEIAALGTALVLCMLFGAALLYYDVKKSGVAPAVPDVPYVGAALRELKVTGDVAYAYDRGWRGVGVMFSADATEDDVRAFCEAAGLSILEEILNETSIAGPAGSDSATTGGILTEFRPSDMSARGSIRGAGPVALYYSRNAGRVTVRVFHPWAKWRT